MTQTKSRPAVVIITKRGETHARPLPSTAKSTSKRAPQVFDFDDDVVDGDLNGADVTMVQVPLLSKHASLLEIPATMIEPLLKSLEDI